MQSPSRHSAGRRFLRTFVFALVQAAVLGTVMGALVSFRPGRTVREEFGDRIPWHFQLRGWIEGLELQTYDWRVRELGRSSERNDEVVIVGIDDETLARARRSDQPGLSMEPWPREVVGGLFDQLLSEGASLVATDLPLSSASPRGAGAVDVGKLAGLAEAESGQRPTPLASNLDDEVFRSILDLRPRTSVLGFSWGGSEVTFGAELRPFLALVGERDDRASARELVQRVVASRLPAFVIPTGHGDGVAVWAGVASEEEGRTFLRGSGVQKPQVRDLAPRDQQFQVGPNELFVELAEIEVEGLSAAQVPPVRFLDPPIASLVGERSLYGAVTLSPDPDGQVRGIQHLVSYRDPRDGRLHLLPSMPLAAALAEAKVRRAKYEGGVLHVGKLAIPMDETGYSLIRWGSEDTASDFRGTLKHGVRAWQVLVNFADKVRGVPEHYRHELKGKVAVLTRTPPLGDRVVTPVGDTGRGAVLGQALANVLSSDGILRSEQRVDFWLTVGLAFVGAFLALSFGGAFRSLSGVIFYLSSLAIAAAGYLLLARHLFVEQRLWVAVAGPLLTMGISFLIATIKAVRTEQEVKEFITGVLGRYVSPEVVRQVMRNVAQMRPERREVTAFFSDVEGFTRFSEKLPPDALVQLLNEYLTEITQVVRKNKGHLDKYMGDVVSAFWGGLPRTDRHAQLACEAALEIREALARRQAEWEKRYGYRIVVRTGLNSGEAVTGDMGSDLKSNYTVMGDAIDLAARLEGQNKLYGTYLLAGERTYQLAKGDFVFREVDRISVKEGAIPVKLYELVCRARELTAERSAALTAFEAALADFHARRFREAEPQFLRCAVDLQDPVAQVYVRRCQEFAKAAPPEGWDGTVRQSA